MRENIIKQWFYSWYDPTWNEFEEIFEDNVYYSESWGPEYSGIEEIRKWFTHWHTHSKLERWQINNFMHIDDKSIVEWTFSCSDKNGKTIFDGVSIIQWSQNDKIQSLKEYASSLPKYNPLHMKNK